MSFRDRLHIESKRESQYKDIKEDKNPVLIWGCGALAESLYQCCMKIGITVEGCFVDIEKSLDLFLGKLPIFTLEEVIKKYTKFSVIIGHANYADGVTIMEEVENVEHIYCPSSVCCNIVHLISMDFLDRESANLDFIYHDLEDQKSRDCFRSYFESRVNDNSQYMFPYYERNTGYFMNDVFQLAGDETLLDIGACVGSAIWSFLEAVNDSYKSVIALEPERNNYQKLVENIEKRNLENIVVKQICAYNRNGYVRFEGDMEHGGIRNTEPNAEYELYPAQTIDSLCIELEKEFEITIVKINFPFSVLEVLEGAGNLLKNNKPRLIIRSGFDENILIKTYLYIKDINPDYKIYLRYSIGIPQGLTIFAV